VAKNTQSVNREWLFFDTHTPRRYRLGWLSLERGAEIKTYVGRPAGLLRRLFGKERERLSAAVGICVVAGPGSFSAIRIGVLYANVLARLFRLPLVGVEYDATHDMVALIKGLEEKTLPRSAYVTPLYDAEPNITLPRAV